VLVHKALQIQKPEADDYLEKAMQKASADALDVIVGIFNSGIGFDKVGLWAPAVRFIEVASDMSLDTHGVLLRNFMPFLKNYPQVANEDAAVPSEFADLASAFRSYASIRQSDSVIEAYKA